MSRAARVAVTITSAAFTTLLWQTPASAATAQPTPVFDCAVDNGDGTTQFFFSYSLPGSGPVDVPLGQANHVAPGNDVGQPTHFDPGTHSAFSLVTPASTATWFLDGRSASGNASNLCTTPPVVAEAGSWLVLPAATAGPLLGWFGFHVRRQRRARCGGVNRSE